MSIDKLDAAQALIAIQERELAELRNECAVRNDEVSGLMRMNAELRALLYRLSGSIFALRSLSEPPKQGETPRTLVAALECAVETARTSARNDNGTWFLKVHGEALLNTVRRISELEAKLAEAGRDAEHQRENKNGAYLERNHLVAALARLFPSGLRRTDIPGWSADWHGCCMIDLPTGQISYHFHDSQAYLFDGLPPYKGDWDGHDKDTVHARLAALSAERKEGKHG